MRTLLKRWWWPSVTAPPDSCRDFHLLRTINTQTCVSAVFLGALIKIRHSELPPSITYNYTFVSVEQQWTKKKKNFSRHQEHCAPRGPTSARRHYQKGPTSRCSRSDRPRWGWRSWAPLSTNTWRLRRAVTVKFLQRVKKKKRRRRKEKGKKEKARWPARLPAAPKQHSTNCRRTKYHQSFMGIKLNKTKRLLQIY